MKQHVLRSVSSTKVISINETIKLPQISKVAFRLEQIDLTLNRAKTTIIGENGATTTAWRRSGEFLNFSESLKERAVRIENVNSNGITVRYFYPDFRVYYGIAH